MLIENGADVHANNENGLTPLHYASIYNALELAVKLIESGAEYSCERRE